MMMSHPVAGPVVRWDGPESLAEVQTLPGASSAVIAASQHRTGFSPRPSS